MVARERPLFEFGDDRRHFLSVFIQRGKVIFQFIVYSALAGNFGKQEFPLVSDGFRIDVLEGRGVFEHAVRMHARLVCKGAHADIRLIFGNGHIRRFRNGHGALIDILELFGRDTFVSALELQVADDGGKVRVAAALAEAEKSPLDLPRARFDGFDGIRHGESAVVVAVDRDNRIGEGFGHLFGNLVRFIGKNAAVRVAQAKAIGARFARFGKRPHRIGGVRLISIKEVFGIEYDLFAVLA